MANRTFSTIPFDHPRSQKRTEILKVSDLVDEKAPENIAPTRTDRCAH